MIRCRGGEAAGLALDHNGNSLRARADAIRTPGAVQACKSGAGYWSVTRPGDDGRCAARLLARRASLLGIEPPAHLGPAAVAGIAATHHLTVVSHACEAWTEFGRLAGTSYALGGRAVNGRFPSGGRPFFVGTADASTPECGCATTRLTGSKIGRSLGIANMAGREDH